MSQEQIHIASVDEIADPGSKGISLDHKDTKYEMFIVKKDSKIVVYENSCPHTLGPLDWTPDQFLNIDNDYIMCANHGAQFEIDSGLCIYGPCKAQSLKAMPFTIQNNNIYVLI